MRVDPEEFASVYGDLRRIAAFHMHKERSEHTLQATALVHEAFMRLMETETDHHNTREDILALAVTCMRNILIDHARKRNAARRSGTYLHLPFDEACVYTDPDWDKLLVLDRVLTDLERENPLAARVLELRSFGGFSEKEIAEFLHRDERTIRRYWKDAEEFLSEYFRKK